MRWQIGRSHILVRKISPDSVRYYPSHLPLCVFIDTDREEITLPVEWSQIVQAKYNSVAWMCQRVKELAKDGRLRDVIFLDGDSVFSVFLLKTSLAELHYMHAEEAERLLRCFSPPGIVSWKTHGF